MCVRNYNNMKTDLSIILLHEHPEYLNECAILLSRQWKRSLSARIQSIEKSYKDLPDSLLLLEKVDDRKELIGHCRLTRVLEDPKGCWIGSVVIAEEKRGIGYGKYFMQKAEEYAKLFTFETVYLNTRDQQGFYEHLGYVYCEPVSMVASKFNPITSKGVLLPLLQSKTGHPSPIEKDVTDPSKCVPQNVGNLTKSVPPPPPPPPMPKTKPTVTNNVISNLGQYWMKKKL